MNPSQLELLKTQALQSNPDAEKWLNLAQNISLGINILYIIIFIVTSYGLYKLSKKLGDKYSWLAFIPLVQLYTYIKTAGYSFGKGFALLVLYSILGIISASITITVLGFLFGGAIQGGNLKNIMIYGFVMGFIGALVFVFVALFFLYSAMAKRAGQSTGTAILMTFFPWCMLYIVSKRISDIGVKHISEIPLTAPKINTEL